MSEDSLITILHISDFHFSKRGWREQDIVVTALLEDLKQECIGHRRPDFIVFSGDLVHAAGVDSFEEAFDKLIDPVTRAANCSEERVIIVPGNHDVERKYVDDNIDIHNTIIKSSQDNDEYNKLFSENFFHDINNFKFKEFLGIKDFFANGSSVFSNEFV